MRYFIWPNCSIFLLSCTFMHQTLIKSINLRHALWKMTIAISEATEYYTVDLIHKATCKGERRMHDRWSYILRVSHTNDK